jgi:glyoxylase-like metal-dependent hydrolase (beta-lactamase superfamily II)
MFRTMCQVNRRNLLLAAAAFTRLSEAKGQDRPEANKSASAVNQAVSVANDVYFHQGDIDKGLCNNGWIIFKDYVLVIDANFPAGAELILPKIRALTSKPIRFAFDTHHHGDHAYGNQVWVDNGATPIAHTGVLEEMKRYETGYYDGKPGRWEDAAKTRRDVATSHLHPPSVLFPSELYFDDGDHRVELHYLGVAHTHGDAVAWLPKERILFTGDACVNGPYNFVGDGDVEKWVATLDAAKKLGAQRICPGHGPQGSAAVLDDQQAFFKQLREQVGALVKAQKSTAEIYQSIPKIGEMLKSQQQIARYVDDNGLPAQVEKVYHEMTGQSFPEKNKPSAAARLLHRHSHAGHFA